MTTPELFLGLMSGTSADGIDAALVEFTPQPRVLAALSLPYPDDLRRDLVALAQSDQPIALDALCILDVRVGKSFATAARAVISKAGIGAGAVTAIGSHGQTLRHRPQGETRYTLQIGDGNVIAEGTGITTVADFRRRDVAAGGQGAPLVPAFHAACLRDASEDRVVLNLGGIANISVLPARENSAVLGFDTGPGNCLLDAWAMHHLGTALDQDGRFASQGRCHDALLQRLLADSYFTLPPPKSTGRDRFHLDWLRGHLHGDEAASDVQATLVALTAQSVAAQVRQVAPRCARVLACGGGVRNRVLMDALRGQLASIELTTTATYGIDPDFLEAMAFAWLARERLAGRPGNLAQATGASGQRVLGAVYFGTRAPGS